jgi:hypothetical protein
MFYVFENTLFTATKLDTAELSISILTRVHNGDCSYITNTTCSTRRSSCPTAHLFHISNTCLTLMKYDTGEQHYIGYISFLTSMIHNDSYFKSNFVKTSEEEDIIKHVHINTYFTWNNFLVYINYV